MTWSRRRFLLASTASALAAARARGATIHDVDPDLNDDPVAGDAWSDAPAYTKGGPIALPDWPYGDDSAAADTVLMFRGDPRHRHYGTGSVPDAPQIRWRKRLRSFPFPYYGKPWVWAGTGWTRPRT